MSRQRRFRLRVQPDTRSVEIALVSRDARIRNVVVDDKQCRFDRHPVVPFAGTIRLDGVRGDVIVVGVDVAGAESSRVKINFPPRPPDPESALRCRVDKNTSPAHELFYELDLHTNELFMPLAGLQPAELSYRRMAIQHLREVLSDRLHERYDGRVQSQPERRHVGYVSNLIRGIIDRTVSADPRSIRRAFWEFASGFLKQDCAAVSGYQACDVDGNGVFLFAEFALTAIELEIDHVYWRDMLNTLVMMVHLYMRRLLQENLKLGIGDLRAPDTVLEEEVARTIRDEFDKLPYEKLEQKMFENLHGARGFFIAVLGNDDMIGSVDYRES